MTNIHQNTVKRNGLKFNRYIRKKRNKAVIVAVLLAVLLVFLAVGAFGIKLLSSEPKKSEFCIVPDINCTEFSKAEKILEEHGLSVRIVGSSIGVGNENVIVWQSVQQGEVLPKASCIDVWIARSAGDMWSWTEREKTLEKLSDSDIKYIIEYVNTPIVANDMVISVEISGSDAVVYINRTKQIVMPNLNGMTENEAAEVLNNLGLAYIKDIKTDAKADKGTILLQYPQAGEFLDADGTALITVCSGKVEVPVFDMKTLGDTERSLTVGQSVLLSVSIYPDAAILNKIEWESSDSSVAVVEPTGKVTAVGEGSAVITAYSENRKYSSEYIINVSDIIVGIEIASMPKTRWLIGDEFSSQGIYVVAHTVGGNVLDITDKCSVSGADLSSECISTVTVEYSEGERTMHAQYDIVCNEAALQINADSVILGINDRHTLHAEYSPEYAEVVYSSSDESIATVSENGVITGVKPGTCTITVDIEGKISRTCTVNVKKKVVYLTFDDGPNTYTDDILDWLDKHNIKATFFCLGNSRYKKIYTRIAEEGHSLGMHSYTHTYSKCYASADAFMKETEKLQNLIYKCTGQRPMILRFPGGTDNTVAKREVMLEIIDRLNKEGYSYFDWNSYSNDTTKGITAEEVAKRVLGSCYDDTEIVLMHNYDFTCDALDIIVPALKRRGYTFKSISLDTPPIRREVRGKGY